MLLYFRLYVNVIFHNYTFLSQILPSCLMSRLPIECLQLVNVLRDASWRSCYQSLLIIWCSPDRDFSTVLCRLQMRLWRTIWFCNRISNGHKFHHPPTQHIYKRDKPLKKWLTFSFETKIWMTKKDASLDSFRGRSAVGHSKV